MVNKPEKIINQAVKDIYSIKIQGAENIAKFSAVKIKQYLENIEDKPIEEINKRLEWAIFRLKKTRPTEPCLQNVLNYVSKGLDLHFRNKQHYLENIYDKIARVMKHFYESDDLISKIGANKIKDGMVVFTHCHSSSVVSLLRRAKKNGKEFVVHNTETRPLFQGRLTARDLASAGIPVMHFVDAAARYALKNADLMLIGADAINTDGSVINKIGSELFVEVANKYDIPVYVVSDSWKFDLNSIYGNDVPIEKRSTREIWAKPPKGVKVVNPAFEIISSKKITGIITELGIYRPEILSLEFKKHYDWLI